MPGASTFAERLNGDGGDVSFVSIQVGVAVGQSAHGEQVAVAEVFGEAFEPPAQNHHVGSGEGEREFFRWSLRSLRTATFATIAAVIGFETVVQKLAGVEAVAVLAPCLRISQEELDTRTVLLGGEDAFAFFELVEAHGLVEG